VTGISWLTAFLDTVPEREHETEVFWARVTGQVVSARRGSRAEFATLMPADGGPFLKLQTVIRSAPGGLHLDLHTNDIEGTAARVEGLGTTAS